MGSLCLWTGGVGWVDALGVRGLMSYGAGVHCTPVCALCTSTVSMHGILGCGKGSYFQLVGETQRHTVMHVFLIWVVCGAFT